METQKYLTINFEKESVKIRELTDVEVIEANSNEFIVRWNNGFEFLASSALIKDKNNDVVRTNMLWINGEASEREIVKKLMIFLIQEDAI